MSNILELYKNAFVGQINYIKNNISYNRDSFLKTASEILNEVFLLQLETEKTKFTEKMLLDYLHVRINNIKINNNNKTISSLVFGDKRKIAFKTANDLVQSFNVRFVKGVDNA